MSVFTAKTRRCGSVDLARAGKLPVAPGVPLTLPLSPEYRGEGARESDAWGLDRYARRQRPETFGSLG